MPDLIAVVQCCLMHLSVIVNEMRLGLFIIFVKVFIFAVKIAIFIEFSKPGHNTLPATVF